MNKKVDSAVFSKTEVNRDSLEPLAVSTSGESVIHRQVTKDKVAEGFSLSRGHPVYPVKLPSKSVSFSIGELTPNAKTSNHRHAYESLIYVLEGNGYSIVEGERLEWEAGDAFYVAPWNWHQHFANDLKVSYLTATNLPLLYSLGQTVLRQEDK